MVQMAPGWKLEVDRGPDWLFVKPTCSSYDPDSADPPLAESVWSLLQQHFTYRLVLECEQLPHLHSPMVGQLAMLHKRISTQGGLMRLCGLSDSNQEVLHACRLDGRFPNFLDRSEAVQGNFRPRQPR